MPLLYQEMPEEKTIRMVIRGSLNRRDYEAVMAPMARFIARCGTIRVLEVVESFTGFEEPIEAQPDPNTFELMSRIRRVALVSDIGWKCPILSAMPEALGIVTRSFSLHEQDAAREWLNGLG
jgi:hypothetical protein